MLFVEDGLFKNTNKKYFLDKPVQFKKKSPILYNKSLTITSKIINKYIYIYKGKLLRELEVPQFSIGFKIGEFAMTRKPFHFIQKVKKKK